MTYPEVFGLYAKPSFIEGIARLVDIGGTLNEYNCSCNEQEADYFAILSDWEAVGQDIIYAMKQFAKEHQEGTSHG